MSTKAVPEEPPLFILSSSSGAVLIHIGIIIVLMSWFWYLLTNDTKKASAKRNFIEEFQEISFHYLTLMFLIKLKHAHSVFICTKCIIYWFYASPLFWYWKRARKFHHTVPLAVGNPQFTFLKNNQKIPIKYIKALRNIFFVNSPHWPVM